MAFIPYILTFFCSILGAVAQIFFQLGMKGFSIKTIPYNFKLIIGLGLYGIATIVYLFAIKGGDVRVLYPIIAFSYIWVFILGYYILNLPISPYHIIGSVLIITGIALINFKTF